MEEAELRIALGEGLGHSVEFVEIRRDNGEIALEFNDRGQLSVITIIGQVAEIVPPEFIARFANRNAKPS